MSPAARALRPFVAREWRALAGAGGATAALTAADLAKPWPLALVVDRLLDERSAPFALEGADVRLLVVVAALVLAIALVEAAAQYFADLRLQVAGERIAHELRIGVYDQLQRLSLRFHQRRQKGDLLTRVTGDVNAMGDLFAQSLGQIVQAALLSVGMLAVLLWLDPVLALVAVATSPLLAAVSWVYRRRVRSQARERRAHDGRIASAAGEALSAMAIVKAYGSETHESARVRRGSEDRMAAGVEVARLAGALRRRRRRRARDRDRPRAGGRGAARRARRALRWRADRVRLLHAQGPQPAPPDGARDDQGRRRDGAHGAARRDPGRRRRARGAAGGAPRGPCRGRARARPRVLLLRRGTAGVARRDAARPGRRARRRDGRVGRGQVDARCAGGAAVRPDVGTRPARRARPARLRAGMAARAGRDRAPGDRAVQRQRARQHRLRLRSPERRRWRRRRGPPPRTASSRRCRTATTRSSGRRAPASRAGSGSASASLARCCATRRCCCSTSRPPASTKRARPSCSTACAP